MSDYKKVEIETSMLPRWRVDEGQVIRVVPKEQWAQLASVYEQYARRYNGILIRSDTRWKNSVTVKTPLYAALYQDEAGHAQGYMLYDVRNREFRVKEIVHLNERARKALWSYVVKHDSMIDRVIHNAPIDDPLSMLLDNPRIKQEIIPYGMIRIVDVIRFMEQYAFAPAAKESTIMLDVKDEHAAWNQATFQCKIDGDGACHVAVADNLDHSDHSLSCNIATLSTMMSGYRTPSQLYTFGHLTGEESAVRELEARIPVHTTYLMDFF